ncbi:hypothetical protein INS49_002872 [Diaporthe citri]|uniref:uncharacterized protein n=1 Tax=Diaporthe citri TaxID=83186 RepID=UPI001C800606|nr:uncharacterized protein INS49_002872 [Diaporthe citri]KAG6368659.1 hypothetical protein INS49_002872 [Diaporthe citri]
MSDGHENHQTGVNDAAIILPIAAMILILSIIPPTVLLICMRITHPEYFRGGLPHEDCLPAVEQPTDKWAHHDPIFRRARDVLLKFHGAAIVAGGAVALRVREVFGGVRGRTLGFLENYRRRRDGNADDDLPVIRNKSWQILAESHSERTFTGFKDDKVEYETVEIVDSPKKTTKTVHFDLGDLDNVVSCVQKPEPAVVAEARRCLDREVFLRDLAFDELVLETVETEHMLDLARLRPAVPVLMIETGLALLPGILICDR